MGDYVKIRKDLLTGIADAIRSAFGLAGEYTPAQMATTITTSVTLEDTVIAENKFFAGSYTEYTNESLTTIASDGLSAQQNLVSISFPNVKEVKSKSFCYSCNKLTSVDFPKLEVISNSFFLWSCSAIKNITLPALKTAGGYGFLTGCGDLEVVDLPVVETIGTGAMGSCNKLKALIIRTEAAVCSLGKGSFSSTLIESGTGYIYVPAALVDTYKADSVWSTFADQFRALEDYTVDGTITGELDPDKI